MRLDDAEDLLRSILMIILDNFFLFLHKNICCGYSSEALLMSISNICFYKEIEKTTCIPKLSSNTPP